MKPKQPTQDPEKIPQREMPDSPTKKKILGVRPSTPLTPATSPGGPVPIPYPNSSGGEPRSMDKIIAPIKPQDKGPAVANLQQAMLFIVEKRELSPANHSLAEWQQALAADLDQQSFGQQTLQLLLALLPALHVPSAEFVTPPVADALNKVLQELGAFAPILPVGARDDAQASKRWSPPRRASGAGLYRPPPGPAA